MCFLWISYFIFKTDIMKNYIKVVDFGDGFFKFIVIVFLDFFKSGKKYKKLF